MPRPLNPQVLPLKQSGIRAASERCRREGGINLGQGVCDIETPELIRSAATTAIEGNRNMYSACEGAPALRQKIAEKIASFNLIDVTPNNVLVTHGSTGAFVCALKTLFQPGDEVIVFEPFYGYHKGLLNLFDIQVKSAQINLTDLSIDLDEVGKTITDKTRAILICTPNNPTGKVYSKEELTALGQLAKKHDLWIITDEIYEYITYPGHEHVSLASLEDFKDRTLTISGFSKTYNMTGWRLGYVSGPAEVIAKMGLVQDLLYVCPTTPLQHAVLAAFDLPESYYRNMREAFLKKRDHMVSVLQQLGFQVCVPQGAYYIMADFSTLGFENDQVAADTLFEKAKVATVTGRSFYINPADGANSLRFCYALTEAKVNQALESLMSCALHDVVS